MLLWIDGFDNYGTSTGVAPQPAGVMTRRYPRIMYEDIRFEVETGRLSGYAIQLIADTAGCFSPGPLTTDATMVVGVALKFGALVNTDGLVRFYDGETLGVNLRLTSAGELAVYRGTTVLGTTSGLGLQINTWYYVELKVLCNDTTGTYEVHVGGVSVLSATGVDTKAGSNAYHTTFWIFGYGSLCNPYFDDLYCLDGSGSANNDFLGNMRVVTLRPNSDGDSSQFTPSAGSNYTCVDEVALNDNTDYVESGTTDNKDLYNYENTSLTTIAGVAVCTDCRETDADNMDLKIVCKSGDTESDGTAIPVQTSSFITKQRLLETDPNTSAAWTPTNLNAAQFGVKVG
jgi:hypothetical protein